MHVEYLYPPDEVTTGTRPSSASTSSDLIIDDGLHDLRSLLRSFKILFLRYLRPGGLYVMEDVSPFYESRKTRAVLTTFLQETL